MNILSINSIITFKENLDNKYRILWLDKKIDLVYLINVNEKYMPIAMSFSNLNNGIEEGSVFFEEDDIWISISNDEDISLLNKEYRDKAWNTIVDLIREEPYIYESTSRRKLILKVSKEKEISESSIKRYLKRYWCRGKIKNALLPDFLNSGAPGKERIGGDKKRGRPRKNTDVIGKGINIDVSMKKVFQSSINKYYNQSNKNPLTTVYELMIRDYFMNNSDEDSYLRIPSLGQFKYWFYKNRNYKKEISTRYGSKRYEQRHRKIVGNTLMDVSGPGSLYQIDATVADVYLVSEFNRNWIIGRPVLYMVLDSFSRMIVGFYVGLEGPSYIGAAMALASVVKDKVELCKEYGVEINEEEWPVRNLPDNIIADRGEMEGKNIESLIENLGVGVKVTPPFRADWKGCVEQNFRVINLRTKPLLPGKVDSTFRERGDKDYRLDAKLTIKEFIQIIIKTILYHNNHNVLKEYDRNKYQIDDDVKPIPIQLWNWGIENMSGRLKSFPEDIVLLNLMPLADAVFTNKGLKFKGMYYSSKRLIEEGLFEKARNNGRWKVKVCYDPRNLNNIYIKSKNGREFDKCFLLKGQERYKDRTLEDINYLMEMEKLDKEVLKEQEIKAKLNLMSDIENIVKYAKSSCEYIGDTNNKRLKGIDDNRRLEKRVNREKEYFELDMNIEEVRTRDDGFKDKVLDELELLKKIQKRGLSNINE